MQDDFEHGMGIPDDELTTGSGLPEMGIGGSDPELGGEPEEGHRGSGGARPRGSSGGSRKPAAAKRAAKAMRKTP